VRLALAGGKPVTSRDARPRWPVVTSAEREAVQRVLDGGKFTATTRGEQEVKHLEREYAQYVGKRYCIAVSSGTSALHAAVAAAGVGPGDEVVVPALTFMAPAVAALHHQGIPVFADIDPVTYNMDPRAAEAVITDRTRAVLPVHLHGLPVDMDEFMALGKRRGVVIIEDTSQAHGALYKGRKVGGIGDIAAGSIMAAKNLPACGEGGLLATDDPGYRERADMIRQFGEVVHENEERQYNSLTMGWNYRMNPIQAAFARCQLERLDEKNLGRQELIAEFTRRLAELPGLLPPVVPPDRTHVYYLFRFRVDPAAAGLSGLEVGRFRLAVHRAAWAEGVVLGEYQNAPVPGQDLFQRREGYGRGCPWTCPHARPRTYDIHDFPVTLQVIESTLCMQMLCDPADLGPLLDAYLEAFKKIWQNLDYVAKYARATSYAPPWTKTARPY